MRGAEIHRKRRPSGLSGFRDMLLVMALLYLVFVIYGSLVPLQFRSLPLEVAVAEFRNLPFLTLGIGSRADWVANLLLFIPLAFLWTAVLAIGRHLTFRVLSSLLVAAGCVALSFGIEFTQLYFPQRTVSQNDIMAESLGGFLGVMTWWLFGSRLSSWYEGWRLAHAPAELAERLAWGYLLAIYAYNLLPLDLTLSAVELFHKWREGKLHLIPFASLPAEPAAAVYELVVDSLLWAVLAFLWGIKHGASRLTPWQIVILSALLLEIMQLFVYSRVSDTTDLVTAAAGGALGAWAARYSIGETGSTAASPRLSGSTAWVFLLVVGWLGVLGTVFWYPFNFDANGMPLRERLDFLGRVPFAAYYFGSEFRAATEVLHKVLFFVPLGGFLAWWVTGLSWKWRSWAAFCAALVIFFSAMSIELGQVFLPEKIPDTTDAFLEMLGGAMGYLGGRVFFARIRPKSGKVARRARHGSGSAAAGKPSNLMNS